MKKKAVILTEGGNGIGFGHIARCTALREACCERGLDCEILTSFAGDPAVLEKTSGLRYLDWLEHGDPDEYLKDADICFIDSYLARPEFYERASEIAGSLVSIDDTNRIVYPSGTVVNCLLGAEKMAYTPRENVRYLLGVEYMPLRRPFWVFDGRDTRETARKLLVSFGGNDMRGCTAGFLHALCEDFPWLEKTVVLGAGVENAAAVVSAGDSRTKVIRGQDAAGMKSLMEDSDLAVVAGGQTLYELARMGVPAAVFTIAGNQACHVEAWSSAGFIADCGWWNAPEARSNLTAAVKMLLDPGERERRGNAGRRLVDGKGGLRVVDRLKG